MKAKDLLPIVVVFFLVFSCALVFSCGCGAKKVEYSFENKKGWKIKIKSDNKDIPTSIIQIDNGEYLYEIIDWGADNYLKSERNKFTIFNREGEKLFEIGGEKIGDGRGINHVAAINGIGLNIQDAELDDKLAGFLMEIYEDFFKQKAEAAFAVVNSQFDERNFIETLENILHSEKRRVFIRELPDIPCTRVTGNLKMVHEDEVAILDKDIGTLSRYEEKYRISARMKAEESLIARFDDLVSASGMLLIRIEKVRVLSSGFNLDEKLESVTTKEKTADLTREQSGLFSRAKSKFTENENEYSFLKKIEYKIVLEVEYSVWKRI